MYVVIGITPEEPLLKGLTSFFSGIQIEDILNINGVHYTVISRKWMLLCDEPNYLFIRVMPCPEN
jgi:hypothetical protein